MQASDPELFARAVALEDTISAKRMAAGKDRVYLTSTLKPLRDIATASATLFPLDDNPGEENDGQQCSHVGYCMI
jgi:hypothetical protein